MKKFILIIGVLIVGLIELSAQEISDNAIGLRFGSYNGVGTEMAYQKKINNDTRVEVDLGYSGGSNYSSFRVTALYQFVFDFEPVDSMNWYVGAGAGLGTWKYDSNYSYHSGFDDSGVYFSAVGEAGVEYMFDFPLLISLDIRPTLGFGDFYSGLHFSGGLSAKYTF